MQLTCAGIGKGTRLAAHTKTKEYLARHGPFFTLPGFADYLLPALVSGHDGCITGTGNVIPKTIVKLYNTATEALTTGDAEKMKEAQRLQFIVTNADWCIIKVRSIPGSLLEGTKLIPACSQAGIGGTKYALDHFYPSLAVGGAPRRPLPPADEAVRAAVEKGMKEAGQ